MYPKHFCRAVCEGVAAQKKLDNLGLTSVPLMDMEEMLKVLSNLYEMEGMSGREATLRVEALPGMRETLSLDIIIDVYLH